MSDDTLQSLVVELRAAIKDERAAGKLELDAAVAAEREACARLIDDNEEHCMWGKTASLRPRTAGNSLGIPYAAAIRARGTE